jgi:acyl carrier protein
MSSELANNVRELMAEVFEVDEDQINDDTNQESLSEWTSLQHMNLLAALEEKYNIQLAMEDMTAMTAFPKVIATLRKYGVK